MKMRIFQRGLILVGLPLLVELVLVGSLGCLIYQSAQERVVETRYRKYSSEIARLLCHVSSAPLLVAASVHFHSTRLLREYRRQEIDIHNSLNSLRTIMAEIPEIPAQKYTMLGRSVQSILKMTNTLAVLGASGSVSMDTAQEFQTSLAEAKRVVALNLDEMFRLGDRMVETAQAKLDATRHSQFVILILVFALNIIMAVGLGIFYRNGIVNRIKTIARNTEALSRGESLTPEIGGNDEIAQFDRAFHSMLEQLVRAAKNEQELFDNASDVICVLDSQNTFVRVNPASQKDWHMKPEAITGRQLQELLSPDDMPAVNAAIADARNTQHAVSFEARIETPEKTTKVGLWSAYWSQEEQQLFCIVHDVSERKVIEAAKKQFLSIISSDLKIPLSKISAALSRILDASAANLNELGRNKLQMAQKNLQRLLSLVNDLLEVARADSGDLELHAGEIDIGTLMSRAAADVEPLAQSKNLLIEIRTYQGSLHADPDRIMQVLVNLLSNAIKFSPDGKKVVLCAEDQGEFVVCRVIDEGRGVPESHRASIFERFSQVEKQDGKRKVGTGLGLPICKQIVEKHGGKIGVESRDGQHEQGSIFWFSLPAKANTGTNSSAAQAQSNGTAQDGEPVQNAAAPQNGKDATAQSDHLSENAAPQPSAGEVKQKAPFGTSLPLGSKGVVLVGIPVIFELIFVAILSNSLLDMQKDRAQELRDRQMALDASKVSKAVLYASSVVCDAADTLAWESLQSCYREWAESQRDLEKLVDDDPFAKGEFDKLIIHSRRIKAYRDSLLRERNVNSSSGIAADLAQKVRLLPSALSLTKHLRTIIEHAELKEFVSPEKELERIQSQFALLGYGLLANIAFSVALAMFFSLSISRRILIMANNAERLANDDALNPVMGGRDELSELDRSFHRTAKALFQARKKERAVFDNSRDVLCIISPAGRFLSVNSAVETTWGFPKRDLLDAPLDQVVLSNDLSACKEALLGSIDPQEGSAHECRIKKKDGAIVHMLWASSRKADQTSTFCVVHDITDRVALDQLRRDFLSMVSHDLRTPLTAVNGVAQIMQTGVFGAVTEAAEGSLKEIRRNVSSLLELIGDILDLEKLDAGKMQLSKEAIRLGEIIEELKKQTSSSGCSCRIEISPAETEFTFEADKERLTQSICNLAKFLCLHSGKELDIAVNREPKNLEFRFTDKGPALAELSRKQLFSRMQESSELRRMGPDGTFHADLVLPLAARTIESHGGSVCIQKTEKEQNLILVLIPVNAPDDHS